MNNIKYLNQKKDVVDFIEAFAKSPKGFLLLSGKNGTGKSYAAMAAYNAVTPYRLPAYDRDIAIFTTQTDLNLRWSEENAKHGETMTLLKELARCKLLVLDDIGTRIPSEAFMDFLYAVADKRYSNRDIGGTIVTTNLNVTDMRERFGDAFVSRVASGKCFRFEGEDRRFNKDAL